MRFRFASRSFSPKREALRYSTVVSSGRKKNSTSSTNPKSLDLNSAYTVQKKSRQVRKSFQSLGSLIGTFVKSRGGTYCNILGRHRLSLARS